jgi:hypothetical protein
VLLLFLKPCHHGRYRVIDPQVKSVCCGVGFGSVNFQVIQCHAGIQVASVSISSRSELMKTYQGIRCRPPLWVLPACIEQCVANRLVCGQNRQIWHMVCLACPDTPARPSCHLDHVPAFTPRSMPVRFACLVVRNHLGASGRHHGGVATSGRCARGCSAAV